MYREPSGLRGAGRRDDDVSVEASIVAVGAYAGAIAMTRDRDPAKMVRLRGPAGSRDDIRVFSASGRPLARWKPRSSG